MALILGFKSDWHLRVKTSSIKLKPPNDQGSAAAAGLRV